ncbi:MAG: c-type cytochrome [Thiohalorhabdus sp.]|uniref:c-type cytochrome n=1 Tax=Thiohalorhabdus sp. TaxID=3094134 RepID=UPI0039810175
MKRIGIVLMGLMLGGGAASALAEEGHSSGPEDSGLTAKEIVQEGIPDKGVAACQSCHGETGESSVPTYPDLAGQYESYLSHSLRGYRDGERDEETMKEQAKNLTDREIDALAGYFSSQQNSLAIPGSE